MKKNKVLTIATILLVVIFGSAYYLFVGTKESAPLNESKNNETQASLETIKESPATDQEKAESQTVKEELANNPNTPVVGSDGKKQVNVVVTDYSPSVVGSFVEGVVEDGGSCTATFKQGTLSFTKTVSAIANVSTSQCERIILNSSDFPAKGAWSTSITYSSPSANGVSQSVTINVE
jgi:hypothetical protein